MSDPSSPSTIIQTTASSREVTERLIWATKPLGLLFLLFWIFHPITVSHTDFIHMGLLGFLAGILYGIVVYGAKLRNDITINNLNQRFKQNRVPEEYYWGNVIKIMYDNK
jgi:hypothetical protein